jgi:hypothetical protein
MGYQNAEFGRSRDIYIVDADCVFRDDTKFRHCAEQTSVEPLAAQARRKQSVQRSGLLNFPVEVAICFDYLQAAAGISQPAM